MEKTGYHCGNRGYLPEESLYLYLGDKISESLLKPGSMLNISFDVESREYNGRWYTDVKAWKVEPAGDAGTVDRMPDDNVHFEEGQMEGVTICRSRGLMRRLTS